MNCVFILCMLVSLVASAVVPEEAQAVIVHNENSNDGAGNYYFSFETSNGITQKENGQLVNVGTEDEHMVVKGSYTYTDAEGKIMWVTYTADENGFHVSPIQLQIKPISVPPNVVATLLGK